MKGRFLAVIAVSFIAMMSDEEQDDIAVVTLLTASPMQIERRRLEDDPETLPDAAIVGAYIDGRLIARCAAPPEWEADDEVQLFSTPRQIMYVGRETDDKTIRAELMALIPPADIPREPWQPEPDDDAPPAAVLLGVVVRLPGDRTLPDLPNECLSHFMAVLGGGGEPVVDRILRNL
jgi:hypothetical protein